MRERRLVIFTAALAACLLPAAPSGAQDVLPPEPEPAPRPTRAEEVVDVRVLADVDRVAPGATFHVAAAFAIAPKWHIYWVDPGDGGAPTEVVVRGPAGFEIGPTRFPRPELILGPEGRSQGYHRETVLFVPVTAPRDLGPGPVSFDVDVFYFVCKEICLVGRARTRLDLPVAGRDDPRAARAAAPDPRLERHRRRLPAPLDTLAGAAARLEPAGSFPGRRLVVEGPAAGFASVGLFPIDGPGVTFGPAETAVAGDRFTIAVDLDVRPHNALGAPLRARGVVALGADPSDPCYSFDIPLEIDP